MPAKTTKRRAESIVEKYTWVYAIVWVGIAFAMIVCAAKLTDLYINVRIGLVLAGVAMMIWGASSKLPETTAAFVVRKWLHLRDRHSIKTWDRKFLNELKIRW